MVVFAPSDRLLSRLAWMTLLTVLAAPACSRLPSAPSGPSTITLNLRYEQGPRSSTPSIDPMCPHHYAPSNLTVSTDWGETARLQEIDRGTYAGALFSAVPGKHWLRVIDISYCGSESGALASTGLSVNNVPLQRFEPVADGIPAFVFTLTRSGRLE